MNEKRVSTLCWAAKALLAGVLVYVVIETATKPLHLRRALKPHAVAGNEHSAALPRDSSEPRPPADVSRIVANDPFASTETREDPPDTVKHANLPLARTSLEEELGLRLIGTVAGGPATSRALIQDMATKSTQPYKIGDVVASATIESIESDAVVLRHQGRRRTLSRSTGLATTGGGPDRPQASKTMTESQPTEAEQGTRPPSAKLGYVEDIFRNATVEPHMENGQTTGLKITGLENTPLAGMFGLRNGDVVQTVNGQDLTSKQKAFQVLQKARTQSQIRIQLLRNEQVKELAFDL
jgi:type II secretion system protein C